MLVSKYKTVEVKVIDSSDTKIEGQDISITVDSNNPYAISLKERLKNVRKFFPNNKEIEKALKLLKCFTIKDSKILSFVDKEKIQDMSLLKYSEIQKIILLLKSIYNAPVIQEVDGYGKLLNNIDDNLNILESTGLLNYAIYDLNLVFNDEDRRLVFRDGFFIYRGVKLDLSVNTLPYDILKIIYEHLGGVSGEIDYQTLYVELGKIKEYQFDDEKTLNKRILNNITSQKAKGGLMAKINYLETQNIFTSKIKKSNKDYPLVKNKYGFGIIFDNDI